MERSTVRETFSALGWILGGLLVLVAVTGIFIPLMLYLLTAIGRAVAALF